MLQYRSARTAKVAALLSATALSAVATPAFAQSYSEQSASNINYTTGTLTGTPEALYLESTGGNVTTSVDTITATSLPQDYASIVRLVTDGGAIVGDFGSITATGSGAIFGIEAISQTGTVDISVGDMDLDGYRTFGVLAQSDGAVSIDAGNVIMRGLTYDEIDFWTPDALVAVSTGSTAIVTADMVTISGLYSTAAAAVGYGDATVIVGDVLSTGTQGSVIYARSDTGDVLIDIGNIDVLGENNSALSGSAINGSLTVNIDSLLADATSNRGINVSAATALTIDAGAVVADAYAINAIGTANGTPDIDVRIYAAAVSATQQAIRLRGDDIDVLIEGEETIVEGVGKAIDIEATGTITLENQGTVTGSGLDSYAIHTTTTGDGATVITSNVVQNGGDGGFGILANSGAGAITIVANETRTTGAIGASNTPDAIVAVSTSGDIAITSAIATTEGLGGSSIAAVSQLGDVTIVSDYSASGGDNGINIYGQGTNVSIDAATVEMAGTGQSVYAVATDFADVRVGDISGVNGAYGVYARASGAAQIVVDGDVHTTEYGALAVSTGLTSVVVNGTVTSDASYGVASIGDQGADATVSEGGSVTGAGTGVVLRSFGPGQSVLFNAGTITGGTAYGASFLGDGEAILVNDGTIVGGELGAVLGTVSGDTVLTSETSRIDGMVDLGDGYDRLQLSQSETGVAATGEVAQTINVELLEAIDGRFRADTDMASSFEKIDIQEMAELVVEVDANGAALTATNIDLDGRLVVEVADETNASITDLTANAVTGTGTLVMGGEGVFVIDDGAMLQQEGGVAVESGIVQLADIASYDGLVTTSGTGTFALGEGDFTGNLVNDGNFVVDRATDFAFVGDFSGTGNFEKNGDSQIVFEGLYSFDGTTTVNGGSVALAGVLDPTTEITLNDGVFDLSMVEGSEATILLLEGDGGTLILGGTDLVVDQMTDSDYAGDITGDGTITKDGTGTLSLSGDLSFTGDFAVEDGKLAINGDASGATFVVDAGGTLGGNGTLGDTTVSGGTLGAGNSIGHLTIDGDLVLTADSTFEVEVNDAGDADLVSVTGMADLGGSTLSVLAEDGIYAPLTTYTILTADGGVSGEFGEATSNFAFLTPVVTYNATDVILTMARNDIDFVDLAVTGNQAGIAGLISDLGFASPLYYQTLLLSQGNVAADFETLTGEQYPALSSALIETGSMLARQIVPIAPAGDGVYAWGKGLVNTTSADARSDWRGVDLDGTGLAGGFGYGKGGLSVSVGAGRTWQDSDAIDLDGLDMTLWTANLAYRGGGLSASFGVTIGNGDGVLSRDTRLGAIQETVEGALDAKLTAVSGEASYGFAVGGATLAPYVGLSSVSVDLDNVQETGGATALRVAGLDRTVTFGDVGLRLEAGVGTNGWVMAQGGLRQAWGDRASEAVVSFANSGTTSIGAMPIDKSALRLGLGGGFTSGRVSLSLGYDGMLSSSFDSHGGKIGLGVQF